MKIQGSRFTVCAAAALLAACASDNAYQHAFSDKSSINGSHRDFGAPAEITLRTAKQTLVRQGFTIDHIDSTAGVIKATRNYQDPKDKDISYNINATVDVSPDATPSSSMVTLAASQQTVLHREWHEWWHLLWIIPLFPIGTQYQTVVTNEGNVTDVAFYNDFFTAIDKSLPRGAPAVIEAPAAPAAVDPSPAADAPPAAPSVEPALAPPA